MLSTRSFELAISSPLVLRGIVLYACESVVVSGDMFALNSTEGITLGQKAPDGNSVKVRTSIKRSIERLVKCLLVKESIERSIESQAIQRSFERSVNNLLVERSPGQ